MMAFMQKNGGVMPSGVTSPSYLVCRIEGDFARLGSKPCPTGFGVSLHTALTSD